MDRSGGWRIAAGVFWLLAAICGEARAAGEAACRLEPAFDLPVTLLHGEPTVEASIGARPVRFLLDSGDGFSRMTEEARRAYGLRERSSYRRDSYLGWQANGWIPPAGNVAAPDLIFAQGLGLDGRTLKHAVFLVGRAPAGTVGALGQSLLQNFDVEYDLPHGRVRLFRTQGCKDWSLAYWSHAGAPDAHYSLLPLEWSWPNFPYTRSRIDVGGVSLHVLLDSAMNASFVTLPAAASLGLKPGHGGLIRTERRACYRGVCSVSAFRFVAPSMDVGDAETVRGARLYAADIRLVQDDMVLGLDFLAAHRVFVANSQHRMYVAYEGGPVFGPARVSVRAPDRELPAQPVMAATPADGAESLADAVPTP